MSRNENRRPAEAGTPVAAVERASAVPTAYPQSNTLTLVREADENATDGAHECSAFGTRDYWALAPEDVPALTNGGEPRWTILTLCPWCRFAMERDGWALQPTEWLVGGAA